DRAERRDDVAGDPQIAPVSPEPAAPDLARDLDLDREAAAVRLDAPLPEALDAERGPFVQRGRIVRARRDLDAPHAWPRRRPEVAAPAVAGARAARDRRAQSIEQHAPDDAAIDQRDRAGRRALVVAAVTDVAHGQLLDRDAPPDRQRRRTGQHLIRLER